MTEPSRLLELANAVQSHVVTLQKYLADCGQAEPSFDAQRPTPDFEGIDDIRSLILEDLAELQDLLMTPRELLQSRPVRHSVYSARY